MEVYEYLQKSVLKIILQQSTPTQIRQLILDVVDSQGSIDGFVEELNSANRLEKHFV